MVLSCVGILWHGCATSAPAPQDLLGLPRLEIPEENPQSVEKVALGRRLFFDKRLSADATISCSTCHDPKMAFSDGRAVAKGLNGAKGSRNTPTLINAAFLSSQFWEGRRTTLEQQALDPFVNAREHGFKSYEPLLKIVKGDVKYAAQFTQAFGIPPALIQTSHIARAIASFERTIILGGSAFDRYQYAGQLDAMSFDAIRGLALFVGRAGCSACHLIGTDHALFTDNKFHSAGIGLKAVGARLAELTTRVMKARGSTVKTFGSPDESTESIDEIVFADADVAELGRFIVTGDPADIGKFRTPTLRNVAETAPYMHDGSVPSLEQVIEIELYARSIGSHGPLILTPGEKQDLVKFLKSLTSTSLGSLRDY